VAKVTTCICGYEAPTPQLLISHKSRCSQWKQYAEQIKNDPDIKRRIEDQGVCTVARELGVGEAWLGTAMGKYHRDRSNRGTVAKPKIISMSPGEIIQAIRTLAEEHDKCPAVIADLRAQLGRKDTTITALEHRLAEATHAVESLREAMLAPIKMRIEQEIAQQARDSH